MEDTGSKRRAIGIFAALFLGLIVALMMLVREAPDPADQRAIVAALIPEEPVPSAPAALDTTAPALEEER